MLRVDERVLLVRRLLRLYSDHRRGHGGTWKEFAEVSKIAPWLVNFYESQLTAINAIS